MPKKQTDEQFIAKAKEVHGDTYDYSKVIYKNNTTKVTLICKEHGEFHISPKNHLIGQGCRLCGYSKNGESTRLSKEEFVARSNQAHHNFYDYSKTDYRGNDTKVTITCPTHGDFQQQPQHHMNGHGCKKCGGVSISEKTRFTKEQFVEQAKAAHGDKYDYSQVEYLGAMVKVKIICPTHGEFWQIPNDHTSKKCGCWACSGTKPLGTPTFVERATAVHQGKYTYENAMYVNTETKVSVTCPKHGDFLQTPHDHLQGVGCPSCGCNGVSVAETELKEFVESLGFEVTTRNRTIIKPYEIDIVIESEKIGIEYDGLFYHSDYFERRSTHANKTKMAAEAGYRLLHVYEDDWRDRRSVVESSLKSILGVDSDKLYARNLTVAEKPYSDVKGFFEQNHLQGSGRGNTWCLLDGDKIVASMQFSKTTSERGSKAQGRYELVRYASSVRVVGGASKLFAAFVKNTSEASVIISYSDNDMFDGGMYQQLGFVKDSDVKPDYKYIIDGSRVHKAHFKRDLIKQRYPEEYSEDLSESEMCRNLGFYRIYNSGLTKWVWTKPA